MKRAITAIITILSLCSFATPATYQELNPTLASLAATRGIHFGTFVMELDGTDMRLSAAFSEYDMYTLPVFFKLVEPQQGTFDFSLPDKIADAAPPGAVFRIPGLIWNELNPDWLTQGNFTGSQLRSILVLYVNTVIQHFNTKYPGRVVAWNIVNEPLSWNGPGGFWHKIGLDAGQDQYEYIRVGLRAARAADPSGKLYLNDFMAEGMNAKSDRMFALVSDLKAQGVPLDGVGLESHFMIQSGGAFPKIPPAKQITQNMDRLATLGLEAMITEADFSIKDSDVSPVAMRRQAKSFRSLLHACLSAKTCRAFATWGIGSKDSWIPQFFPGWGNPLLFDSNYNPNLAYDSIKEELLKN